MTATTAHYHLVIANFEAWQRLAAVHFHLVPGNVVNPPGVFVDKMMMTIHIGIEQDRVGSEMQLAEQAFLDE